jgi:hypothetical protein
MPRLNGVNRIYPVFLCIYLLGASLAYAASLELRLPNVEAKGSEIIKSPIRVKDGGGLGAVQMDIVFDPSAVEVTAVEASDLLSNAMVEFKTGQGRCKIAFVSSEAVIGGGNLLTLSLRTHEGSGRTSTLTAQNVQAWEYGNSQAMNVSIVNGKVMLPGGGMPIWIWAAAFAIVVALGGAVFGYRYRGRSPSAAKNKVDIPEGANYCCNCGNPRKANAGYCYNCGAKYTV